MAESDFIQRIEEEVELMQTDPVRHWRNYIQDTIEIYPHFKTFLSSEIKEELDNAEANLNRSLSGLSGHSMLNESIQIFEGVTGSFRDGAGLYLVSLINATTQFSFITDAGEALNAQSRFIIATATQINFLYRQI